MRAARKTVLLLLPVLLLGGCSGWQSVMDPKGPHAKHLADLIWFFTAFCSVVWLAVMAVLVVALLRRAPVRPDPLVLAPATERRSLLFVGSAAAATLLAVIGLTVLSYVSQGQLFAKENAAVTLKVTGHQWWWDVVYEGDTPDQTIRTANEIHVPVGQPVSVKLAASDVIHSFWVPSLTGKQDLIPGQDNEIQFTAGREGVYRGQCAEFCGWQHAHMGLMVLALPLSDFKNWQAAQHAPAASPQDAASVKGGAIFQQKACALCHTIRGTPAGSLVGPDLTHFASRKSIASATLPMSRGNIAAWIVDPQGIKPGVNMPDVPLAPDEVDPLVSYLAGLK
jgi:cytochrome c oxidase subunit 2